MVWQYIIYALPFIAVAVLAYFVWRRSKSRSNRLPTPDVLQKNINSETAYYAVLEPAPFGVVSVDESGRITFVNAKTEEIFGFARDELLGQPHNILIPDRYREPHARYIGEFFSNPHHRPMGIGMDLIGQHKEGHEFPVEVGLSFTKIGESARAISFITDITKRKQMEHALHDSESRFRTLVEQTEHEQRLLAEALRDVAAALNSTLDLEEVLERILVNLGRVVPHDTATIMLVKGGVARVVRLHGYTDPEEEAAVKALRLNIDTTPNLRWMAETGQLRIVPDTQDDPGWLVIPGGPEIRSYAGVPIRLEGKVVGFLNLDSATPGFFTPAHAERLQAFADEMSIAIKNARLYEELQIHATELEASNQELDAYGHTIAHDLKNPLSLIAGYVAMLQEDYTDDMSPEVRGFLKTIESFTDKMSEMIDGLLLLSTLRRADEVVEKLAMAPIVESALARFADTIKEREIAVEIAPDLPPALGYGPWVEEGFANLIGNAIKYIGKENPDPRITIRGFYLDDDCTVRYEVEDNGLGLTPESQERLFEMFTRFHVGEAAGFGLGLTIVQRIVTKLNGTIGVESEPGKGSTFWFTLPAPPS